MIRLTNSLRAHSTKLLLTAITGMGTLAIPSIASADTHDRGRFDDRDRHESVERRDGPRFGIGFLFGGSSPTYQEQTERVWVDPVYRTTYDRVWRDAVVRNDVARVWVPPVYETRQALDWVHAKPVYRPVQVLVSPGHWEDRPQQAVVSPAHWEDIARQELVAPGHWEYRTTEVRVEDHPNWSFGFGFRGH